MDVGGGDHDEGSAHEGVLFRPAEKSEPSVARNALRLSISALFVEESHRFVVFFQYLDYLLPLNNRQKLRHELHTNIPHNRSLLL